MSQRPQRVHVGAHLGLAERMRVFRIPDALEVDSSDHFEIYRRRVFLDEVLLVTLHKGWGGGLYPWVIGVLAFLSACTAGILFAVPEVEEIRNGFLIATAALVLLAVATVFIPAWTVTVYGRRTRARMRYRFREEKARAVYAEVCAAAAAAQQALAARQPQLPPQPPTLPSSPIL